MELQKKPVEVTSKEEDMELQKNSDGTWSEAEPIEFKVGFIGRLIDFIVGIFKC